MMFVAPMLAQTPPKPKGMTRVPPERVYERFCVEIFHPHEWVAEEKYDGWRLCIEISNGKTNLFSSKGITAWTRYGNLYELPTHILEELCELPDGIYDGEILVPGKRSYGTATKMFGPDLVLYLFDLLQMENTDITPLSYLQRTKWLQKVVPTEGSVRLAAARAIGAWEEVIQYRDEVWARDGEGLILKRITAPYIIGKRSKDWIKIKNKQHGSGTVIGFEESRGEINYRGPFAMTILRDSHGVRVSVKTRTDALCREAERLHHEGILHPWIGRTLLFEYQELTPDGYRHPRWDRWSDE